MFGLVLLPFILGSNTDMAWVLWWIILIAELLTLWMLADIQSSLGKLGKKKNTATE